MPIGFIINSDRGSIGRPVPKRMLNSLCLEKDATGLKLSNL